MLKRKGASKSVHGGACHGAVNTDNNTPTAAEAVACTHLRREAEPIQARILPADNSYLVCLRS